ncbi:MAG: hypothetical protein CMG75_03920 [Candidatus Marinimicrobia bacterium]|nr:hypothetical protein [Candidatus Neomarinimicrobiota bacterium]
MKTKENKATIFLAIIGVSFLFSFTNIAAKEAVMNLSPWAVAFFRFLIGSFTLYVLMKSMGKTINLLPIDKWRFVTLAFLAVPLNQITFLAGIQYTPASHPALLYATTPAWVLLLALWLRIEKLRWWKWAGIVLAILGVGILFLGEFISFRRDTINGDLLLMVALFAWALYTTLGKPIVERYGALETTFVVITFGFFLYVPFGIWSVFTADYSQITSKAILAIIYIGIFASGIAYFLWYWLLARIRPSQVAIITCLGPPLTAFFEWTIFGTVPTLNLLLSSIVVLMGIVLMVGYGGTKQTIKND